MLCQICLKRRAKLNMKNFNFNNNKKPAFTLAEAMITIGLIGIVAAMTMPMLMTNYQKKVTLTQLKKVVHELNQAMKFAVADAKFEELNYAQSSYDFFKQYLTSIMVVSETTMQKHKAKGNKYRQISGAEEVDFAIMKQNLDKVHILNLNNGAQLILNGTPVTAPGNKSIYVDVNGFAPPNTFGKDVYCLYITRNNKVLFMNTDDGIPVASDVPRDTLINGPSAHRYQCNSQGCGAWCGALLQADGWEFRKDYPW